METQACLSPGTLIDALGHVIHDPESCTSCRAPHDGRVAVVRPPDGGAAIRLGLTPGAGFVACDIDRGVYAHSPGAIRRAARRQPPPLTGSRSARVTRAAVGVRA